MEVPRQGWNLSGSCDLRQQLQQRPILNPLRRAGDLTQAAVETTLDPYPTAPQQELLASLSFMGSLK